MCWLVACLTSQQHGFKRKDQLQRNLTQNDEPQRYSLGTQKKICLSVGCLTSQQHASVSQGPICSDNLTCCHIETEVADPTFRLTQSQYTGTGPTSPSADLIPPGAWQASHWSATFEVTGVTRPLKSRRKQDSNPGSSALEADALTTRPTRRLLTLSSAVSCGPLGYSQSGL